MRKVGKLLGKEFGNVLIIAAPFCGPAGPFMVAAGTYYNVYCIGDQKFSSFQKQLAVNMGAYYIGQQLGGGGGETGFEKLCVATARGAISGAANAAISSAIYGGNMWKAMLRGAGRGAMYAAAFYIAQPYIQGTLEQMEKFIYGIKVNIELTLNMEIFPDLRIPAGTIASSDPNFIKPAITINAKDWERYLQGVYDDVQDMSPVWYHVLWPFRAACYDTTLYGSNLYTDVKAKQALYYIEPLDVYAYGWEINYVGQGMLYERFVLIPGLDNIYAHTMPFTWKVINSPLPDYKLKDAWNPNIHKMAALGTREYSRIKSER